MNAVVAALLGTLLGSLATIGAAVVAGWAQREGARIAARSQYVKDRHEPRRAEYKAFMKVATELSERILTAEGYRDSTLDEEMALRRNVHERWIDLSLAGPDSVIKAGARLRDCVFHVLAQMAASRRLVSDLHSVNDEDEEAEEQALGVYEESLHALDSLADLLIEEVGKFAEAASAALDDDGTAPRSLPRGKRTARRREDRGVR
ncbi:hypothetical protein ACOZE4_00580 [Streptomyces griseoincarnatus]